MDLLQPVKLKNELRTFEEYCNTVRDEQKRSLEYLETSTPEWNVPPQLRAKISESGHCLPYYGDTVVLCCNDDDIKLLNKWQKKLQQFLDFLATPIPAATFHVTLHDLSHAANRAAISRETDENRQHCREVFSRLKTYFEQNPEHAIVNLEVADIYPMNQFSIVVGLLPATDKDFKLLMNTYNLFEEVQYLDYWLRPHITLDYFRSVRLSKEQIARLGAEIKLLNPQKQMFTFDLRRMAYQTFTDMNHYHSEFILESVEKDFEPLPEFYHI